MVDGPSYIATVVAWGKKNGYDHAVVVRGRHPTDLADALEWAKAESGDAGVMSWRHVPPVPSIFVFRDPHVAFEFKIRYG